MAQLITEANMDETPPLRAHSKKQFYHPELDSLRALAFFMVFATHTLGDFSRSLPWMGTLAISGAFGVCLFFVLSSFLITELLLRELEDAGTVGIRQFFIRRALRIWPLYFTFLAVGFVWHILHHSRLPASLMLAYSTFWANWWYVLHGLPSTFLSPLWSISVEEQFYLIWPLIAFAGGKRGMRLVAAVGWVAFLPALYFTSSRVFLVSWPNSIIQAQFFAVGAILALALHGKLFDLAARTKIIFSISGFLVLIAASRILISGGARLSIYALAFVFIQLGCGLLLLGFYKSHTLILRIPFVLWLGKISYGLYVFHLLALELTHKIGEHLRHSLPATNGELALQYLAALVITVIAASLSYQHLEKPFLKLKERFAVIRSRPA